MPEPVSAKRRTLRANNEMGDVLRRAVGNVPVVGPVASALSALVPKQGAPDRLVAPPVGGPSAFAKKQPLGDYRRNISMDWLDVGRYFDRNPLESLLAVPGDVLGTAWAGLDWLSYQLPERIAGELVSLPKPGPLTDVEMVKREQGPQAAWAYAQDKMLPGGWLTGLAVETLLNPTSLIGFGLAGRAAKAIQALGAGTRGAGAANIAAKGLQGAQKVEDVYNKATSVPFEAAGKLLGKLPLFQLSKQGMLSVFQDKLADALSEAKGLGYRYQGLKPLAGGGAWPGSAEAARKAEATAWGDVEQKIGSIADPLARHNAVMVKEQANMNAAKWSQDALRAQDEIRAAGGPTVKADIDELWQVRHRKTMQLIEAVRQDLGKVTDEVPGPGGIVGPPQATGLPNIAASKITDDMVRAIRGLTSTTRDAIEKAKKTMTPDEVREYSDNLFRGRNEGMTKAMQEAQEKMKALYYPQGGEFPETGAFRDLQGRVAEMQAMNEGLPGFIGKMSTERGQTLSGLMPSIDRYAKFVDRDRNAVGRIVEKIQLRNPGLEVDDVGDSAALLKRIKPFAQDFEFNDVKRKLQAWTDEGKDLLANDPLELVEHRIGMDRRKTLEIKTPGPIGTVLRQGVQGWKEQALLSPRFHLQNMAGIEAMSTMAGVNPGTVARALGENLAHFAKTRDVQSPSMVRQAMGEWEQVGVPNAVKATSLADNMMGAGAEILKRGESPTVLGRIPVLGKVLGPIVETNKMLAGAIEHAARSTAWLKGKDDYVKAQLPDFIRGIRRTLRQQDDAAMAVGPGTMSQGQGTAKLAQGMTANAQRATAQATQRKQATKVGLQQAMDAVDSFDVMSKTGRADSAADAAWRLGRAKAEANVRKALEAITSANAEMAAARRIPVARLTQLETQGIATRGQRVYGPQRIAAIETGLRSYDGRMGPKKLGELLAKNGVDLDTANAAAKQWMDVLQQGDVAGEKLATKINFDYGKTDNLEEMLRYVVPFLIWPKRAIPFFAQALLEHPGFVVAIDRYRNISEEDAKELSPRFTGMVSAGTLPDFIARKLFGTPTGKLMANPLDMIMPFADVGARGGKIEEPGDWFKVAQDLGLGPGPWVTIPATIAGVFGDKPYGNVLRHSGMLQGVTGVDIEAPWKEGAANLQETLTGKEAAHPAEWQAYLIEKRIQEKSVEETGKAQDPRYVAAVHDPNDPIYQQAAHDVQREKGTQSWMGFLSPVYSRVLPGTEEAGGKARAALPVPQRNENYNIGPMGELDAQAAYNRGDKATWQAYADKVTAAGKAAREDLAAAVEANPAAATYGQPRKPIHAANLWSAVSSYKRAGSRSAQAKVLSGSEWLGSYLYWWRAKGHDTDNGDVGTEEDVKAFLGEKERQ